MDFKENSRKTISSVMASTVCRVRSSNTQPACHSDQHIVVIFHVYSFFCTVQERYHIPTEDELYWQILGCHRIILYSDMTQFCLNKLSFSTRSFTAITEVTRLHKHTNQEITGYERDKLTT